MKIASILRRWRVNEGLTVRQAAEEIGVSSATYCRIENGRGADCYTTVKLISWLFGEEKPADSGEAKP